jgi:hypothetical protein
VAFTSSQKQQIRNYLGAPAVFVDMQHRLEGAMDAVGGNAEAVTHVTAWLTELAVIDDNLEVTSGGGGGSATYGSLKKVDEIEFYSTSESGGSTTTTVGAVDRGRMLIQRIARILGVADVMPVGDYFSARSLNTGELALG